MLTIPCVMQYTGWALFLLRLMAALVFGASGFNHLRNPRERAASLGMSIGFTAFLGAAELAGAIALAIGFLTQWAALGLMLVMLGAIYRKAVKWKTGFWGEKSSGWNYELMLLLMCLVIFTTGGGSVAIMRP